REIYDEQLANQTKGILQLLALAMMQQKATEIQPAASTPQLQQELQQVLDEGKTLKQLLAQTDSASGLLIEVGSDTYAFAHQSIQDYLAVIQIRAKGQEHLILENLDQQWWYETIHLYAMQLGDATAIVQEAIRRATPETLTLASSFLQDNVPMDDGVRQQLQETLDNDLKHPNPKIAALAAQVKLMSRLRHLHPIDETRAIDLSYVTHAEYQMFLDAQPPDQSLWPDHWKKPHFQPASALHPIVGLRATDARTFCEWLTQTLPSSNPTVTIRYRLPTEEEAQNNPAQNNPAQNNQVGGWCVGGRQRKSGADIVQGISDRWWEQWQRSLSTRVGTAIDGDRPVIYQLANNDRLNLSLQFFADQPHVSLDPTLDLGKAVKLVPNPQLVPPSSLISRCTSNDQSMQSSLRALEQAVQLLRRKVPNERRLLDRQQLNYRSFQEVRAYLLVVMALWDALTVAFDALAEKRRQVKILSRLWAYSYERDYRNCKAQRDRTLTLYAFFVLMDARRGGTMPAWEGIRLVKETIQN
ncbi:MAG: SUMF1/EgtB/PvdO family nonheme iron enzyme, partial [Cyanobacteria bacterium J06638_22]